MRILFKDILKESRIAFPFEKTKDISIENKSGETVVIHCELAETDEEIIQGLLYRKKICEDCGVLFKSTLNSSYHMVGMEFSIEMIFINDGVVVDIIKATPGEENISPTNRSSMNLEVNDGFCDKNGITVGDNVNY